ncbi:DNA internalization-related competence protein ComEC/Rec2 [Oceanisphaera sp. IT1-181]|uniref:DNA internalization-related competence protein ComEC/Rec2 n=1 Tax=Oceanisphaera sp. IT1-181 TaxID=3081199 RepID=UPI0029C9F5CB|nr:DNA internalization-related competence protein ComEC/Rec2 [Oceanisphaera sp. IT1-181]
MLACLLLGFVWALCYSHWQLSWLQYPTLFERTQIIAAQVEAVQSHGRKHSNTSSKLIVRLSHLNGQALSPEPRLLLSWQSEHPPPQVGQSLQTITQLRLPHGLHNPGTFNRSRWLLGQGITAQANVSSLLKITPTFTPITLNRRARWVMALQQHTQGLKAQAWILALSVGDKSGLQMNDWAMLRGLGISHLFAISGLHIGLVAGLGLLLGRVLGSLTGHRHYGVLLALGLALAYAWLAGFSVPTQRALMMLLLWLSIMGWGRFWGGRRILLLTASLLLAAKPWLALNHGFWLSVLAVAALLLLAGWQKRASLWRLQLGLTVLLLPLVMLLFGGLSWLSLPANLVLIPLFTLVLIPLLLLACLLLWPAPILSQGVFKLLDTLFNGLMAGLHGLNELASPWVWLSAPQLALGFGLLLLPLLLLPKARSLSLLPASLLALWLLPQPKWEVRVLDVGQGLTVLVSQGTRALLYDTGNRFPSGFNMADAVILPLLRHLGISQLDYVVISHNDQDHSGNRDYLARTLPIGQRWGAWPAGQQCRAGQKARWGELKLRVLWPVNLSGHSNNDSCVLHITDGRISVLLTGDIEAKAEQGLLATQQNVQAELLLSPHHGSNSSSTLAFNQAVNPDWVVHTAGFGNRWGFPSSEVLARFESQKVPQITTGEVGMVHLVAEGEHWRLVQHQRPGAWYDRLNTWLQHTKPLE